MVTICPLKYSYLTYIYNTGRNDPGRKRLTAESTHQSRPKRLTSKIGRNDPGRIDPAETTHGPNDPDSSQNFGIQT